MDEPLLSFLGKPASALLGAEPFSKWNFKRSSDKYTGEIAIHFTASRQGISLNCDRGENVKTIFLYADKIDPSVVGIDLSSSRAQVLNVMGTPTRTGASQIDKILGELGAWDRFDYADHCVHIQYDYADDKIKLITLMRADIAP